jgi:HEAT repeat protein
MGNFLTSSEGRVIGRMLLGVVFPASLLVLLGTAVYCAGLEDIRTWEAGKDTKSLIEALMDKNSSVREAAAKALGRMGDPRAVIPLVKALGDPLNGVRDAAAVALKKLNEPLGERIYESLKGSSKAWEELARLNDPRAIAPLVKALGAWDWNVRANAAWTLRKLGDQRAVEPLINTLGDRSAIVRGAAAWALHDFGDRRAVDPMVKALSDTEESVREAAAWTLGKLKDPRAVEPLIPALQDWFYTVREAAAWALGELGDPRAVIPLIDALGDTHGKVREAAVWALLKLGDRRAVDPLLKTLGDPDPKVREASAVTLGTFGDHRAVDPLLKIMGDEDSKIREAASRVLEKLGEPLGRLIQSSLAGSREAGNELAVRKDPRSLDPLILSLRDRDGQVRRAAATVLGKIRDPRAIDGLVVMAGGWGIRDRWVATVALLEIDQKFFPDLLTAVFRVMARPASLVYLLCTAGIPILAVYGPGWVGRRRGRRV